MFYCIRLKVHFKKEVMSNNFIITNFLNTVRGFLLTLFHREILISILLVVYRHDSNVQVGVSGQTQFHPITAGPLVTIIQAATPSISIQSSTNVKKYHFDLWKKCASYGLTLVTQKLSKYKKFFINSLS